MHQLSQLFCNTFICPATLLLFLAHSCSNIPCVYIDIHKNHSINKDHWLIKLYYSSSLFTFETLYIKGNTLKGIFV